MPILSLDKTKTLVERRSSGIAGLDELIDGGFPNHSGIALFGPSGCGKSLFCKQFIWEGLKNGEFGLYIAFDHPPSEIRQSMATFRWDVTPYEDKGIFMIVDCFNGALGIETNEKFCVKNPSDVNEQMYVIDKCVNYVVKTFGRDIKVRVAYDSAPLDIRNLSTSLRISKRLLAWAKIYNVVGLSPMHKGSLNKIFENTLLALPDGVVDLDKRIENGMLNYYLWISKMMMTPHSREVHPYTIMDDGIHVMKPKTRRQ